MRGCGSVRGVAVFSLDCFGRSPRNDDCDIATPLRHCELRSSEAIQKTVVKEKEQIKKSDGFTSIAFSLVPKTV
jgi:hypothetical protein